MATAGDDLCKRLSVLWWMTCVGDGYKEVLTKEQIAKDLADIHANFDKFHDKCKRNIIYTTCYLMRGKSIKYSPVHFDVVHVLWGQVAAMEGRNFTTMPGFITTFIQLREHLQPTPFISAAFSWIVGQVNKYNRGELPQVADEREEEQEEEKELDCLYLTISTNSLIFLSIVFCRWTTTLVDLSRFSILPFMSLDLFIADFFAFASFVDITS